MTKYRIKLRRNSLTRGQIERHKNFDSLYVSSSEEKKSFPALRLIAIILGIAMVIMMIMMGIHKVSENKKEIERQKIENQDFFDEV